MNIKLLILVNLLIFSILLVISCSEKSVTEVEQLSGLYKAIAFTEPGPLDGGYDILANGGALTVRLFDNYELEGHIHVPSDTVFKSPTLDEDFSGTFTLNDGIVRFKNTGYFDYDPWKFIVKGDILETPDWTGRAATIKIILKLYSE